MQERIGLGERELERAYAIAEKSMSTLNRVGAGAIHKFGKAATDVTGFGLLGHAVNLAEAQKLSVAFEIERLPIIRNMELVSKEHGLQDFRLMQGFSAETSGGLFVAVSRHNVEDFKKVFDEAFGPGKVWEIGRVKESKERKAYIVDSPEVIHVDEF